MNSAGGIGVSAGSGADAALETVVSTLNATTTAGTIQINEADGATLSSVMAGGSGDVRIVSATGDLDVQTVIADGDRSLRVGFEVAACSAAVGDFNVGAELEHAVTARRRLAVSPLHPFAYLAYLAFALGTTDGAVERFHRLRRRCE